VNNALQKGPMKFLSLLVASLFSAAKLSCSAAILYVSLTSTNPLSPYTDWTTAATNIQDAVDAAVAGDTVLVTNGVYDTGGRVVYYAMTNRLAVTKPLTIQSVNGAAFTTVSGYKVPSTITGDSAIRCLYLTNGASMVGFTLANGATRNTGAFGDSYAKEQSGGAVYCDGDVLLANCVISNNTSANYGGGAIGGTFSNCTFIGNSCDVGGGAVAFANLQQCLVVSNSSGTSGNGGGAIECTLTRCTLKGNLAFRGGGSTYSAMDRCLIIGNSANDRGGGAWPQQQGVTNCVFFQNSAGNYGGGVADATMYNCTICSNSAGLSGGGAYNSGFGEFGLHPYNCIIYYNSAPSGTNYNVSDFWFQCCTFPMPAFGINFTNEPSFIDLTSANLRLQSNSICINAGSNSYISASVDLDGRPRIVSGTVDIGAYEYQGSGIGDFIGWLQQFGLPTDGSADFQDADSDGANNWQEWIAGTVPTDASSLLKMLSPVLKNGTAVAVTWQSVTNRSYFLQRSTNLSIPASFSTISSNISGQPNTTTFTDANATALSAAFYRVGVQ
jgi:predicted outer membrane repeat protein